LTLVDVGTAPKTSIGVATGTQHSMRKKVGVEKLWGVTSDSGRGTPESLSRELDKKGLIEDDISSDSCGLHDLMSCFRLPCQHFIGTRRVGKCVTIFMISSKTFPSGTLVLGQKFALICGQSRDMPLLMLH
jgi:hypothetical protein